MTDPTRRNDPGEEQRLKEALFGPELDQLHTLMQRYGDDTALAESVRRVIVDVLRKAGIQDHDRVAEALAPMVTETVAQEIPRQRGRIASALLPHASRLFVAGAGGIATGLARGVDAVASPLVWIQRVQGLVRGQRLGVVQLGRGLWLEGMALLHEASDADVFSDFDPATTQSLYAESTHHALTAGEPILLHFGDTHYWMIRLNGLVWLVAAHGGRSTTIGDDLARIFAGFSHRWRDSVDALGEERANPVLAATMARDLELRCRETLGTAPRDPLPRPRPWFGYTVLSLGLAAAIAWGGWLAWQNHQAQQIVARAEAALQDDPSLANLPLTIQYNGENNRLTVRGIVGSRDLPERVEETLRSAMQGRQLDVLLIAPPPLPLAPTPIARPTGNLEEQVRDLYGRLNAMQEQLAQASMQSWFAQQIVRFESGTDYFDPGLAQQQIQSVVQLFEDWPPEFNLRIVGYSDATGSDRIRESIALDRALTVMRELIAAGVPSDRLMAVGRADAKPLSFIQGDDSVNRRVEFEVYSPAALGG